MSRKTILSPCRTYRYVLWREWSIDSLTGSADDLAHPNEYLNVIGLNPSTADETVDDATILKCVKFAKAWGYGALCMTNLFAFRATDPMAMKRSTMPVGPDNNQHLAVSAAGAGLVVCAWGNHGDWNQRADGVRCLLREQLISAKCFRVTKQKHPEHPLYQKDDAMLIDFIL